MRRQNGQGLARDGTAPLESNGPHHPHTALQDTPSTVVDARLARRRSVPRGHSTPARPWTVDVGRTVFSRALPASAAAQAVETRSPNSRRPATGQRRERHWRRGLRLRTGVTFWPGDCFRTASCTPSTLAGGGRAPSRPESEASPKGLGTGRGRGRIRM
jgi:hypothetical protein